MNSLTLYLMLSLQWCMALVFIFTVLWRNSLFLLGVHWGTFLPWYKRCFKTKCAIWVYDHLNCLPNGFSNRWSWRQFTDSTSPNTSSHCCAWGRVVLPLKGDEFSETPVSSLEGVLCGEGFCGTNANVSSSSPFFLPSASPSLFLNTVIHTCTSHYREQSKPQCFERHCFCEGVWSFDAGWQGTEAGQSPTGRLELSCSGGTVWQPTINESQ